MRVHLRITLLSLAVLTGSLGYFVGSRSGFMMIMLAPALVLSPKYIKTSLLIFYLGLMSVVGMLNSMAYGIPFKGGDFLALALSMILLGSFARYLSSTSLMEALSITLLIAIAISAMAGFYLGNYYYGGSITGFRLIGLAVNPNQFALYCLCTLILISKFMIAGYAKVLASLILSVIGLLTGSEAFLMALVAFVLLKSFWVPKIFGNIFLASAVILTLVVLATAMFGEALQNSFQAQERFTRWLYAAILFSDHPWATLTGMGVGSWGPSYRLTFASELTGFGPEKITGSEFHNSALDFLSAYGLVGCYIFFRYLRSFLKSWAVSPELVSLMVFSSFHLAFRHPIFWGALLASIYVVGRSEELCEGPKTLSRPHSNKKVQS